MDVEASRAIRQAEVGASQTMIERTEASFGIKPEWLAADTAYGSASNLDWLVNQRGIAPHVPVIDKSKRDDGTFNREDFTFDKERNVYICPAGKVLTTTGRLVNDGETTLLYFASVLDCRSCPLKVRCCPKMPARRIPRSIYEEARDVARGLAKTKAFEQSRRDRTKIEMLFAHLKRSCGLADCAFAVPWARSSSSRWRRLPRTFAGGKASRTASADRAYCVRCMSPAWK